MVEPGIVGIETGYEARYDFPSPGRLITPYLLASVPRSGSTYLSHLLWATGCLGAPLEYLNFDEDGPYGFANRRRDLQRSLWRTVMQRRVAQNGVFGVKCFPMQLQWLQKYNLPLLSDVFQCVMKSDGPRHMIRLSRRDRQAHEISYARAMLSGIWRWEQEAGRLAEPDYSSAAIARASRLIDREERSWDEMVADMGLKPLRLWHEDVVADPQGAILSVAAYLGTVIDRHSAVSVPEIRKQSSDGARAWSLAMTRLEDNPPHD